MRAGLRKRCGGPIRQCAVGLALGAAWAVVAVLPATAGHDHGWTTLNITAEIAKRYIDEGVDPIFVDLRPVEDFKRGRLPGARSVPLRELQGRAGEVPRQGLVILYCACPPKDAQSAYQLLRDRGYRNIAVLEEGFAGWVKSGYPTER